MFAELLIQCITNIELDLMLVGPPRVFLFECDFMK